MNMRRAVQLLHGALARADSPAFRDVPRETEDCRRSVQALQWTCEGCGGTLIGGDPPLCLGCRKREGRPAVLYRGEPDQLEDDWTAREIGLLRMANEYAVECDAQRQHAEADHAALARVMALAARWEEPDPFGLGNDRLTRPFARQLRKAVLGIDHPDAQ